MKCENALVHVSVVFHTALLEKILPEEKIKAALQEHLQNIRQQVFDSVLNNSPEFFEHLVVDLLLKMGYELVDSLVNEIKLQATTALKQEIVRKTNEKLRRVIVDDYVEIESIDRYIKLKGRDGASEGQTLSIAYCFLGTLFEDSELEFPFIIDSPTGKMDFEKRQAVADIIPLVFNQMIAFVQSAEVERFADRFYANPDSQYLTVVASPQDQAVVVYEGIDFFDSYQREHKGDGK